MLTRKNRFNKSYQVRYVLKNGHSHKEGPLLFKYVAQNDTHNAKIAVVVSKKVHKSAVVRNRIRRRVFEMVRVHKDNLVGFDLVIMVYAASVASMSAAKLQEMISKGIDHIRKTKS